ncbi:site-specific integrase [Nocardioides sp. W7]|uniref:tyrosine-type recombinase/integrase n=1 Tax=Nocardioides sp. W7 TaxID=2931390 RepID=UPI001FD01C22|nr:site-specific integrase [Nocardioides sp. W7]
MGRPRTPIGTFGQISFSRAGRKVRARTRYRDDDGRIRRVQASGATEADAVRRLKAALAQRESRRSYGELSPDSSFTTLVKVWLEDLDLDGELARSTRDLYERDMRTIVLPAFEHLLLREITVSRVDRFLRHMAANRSYAMAKHARTVLSLALGLAVRYDALARNPVRETKRLRKPPTKVKALSVADIAAVRAAVRAWRRDDGLPGPRPDGQLEQIVEVMLGSSARIGEVLALRKCDVDVTRTPARVRICGTIVSPKGVATYRQAHPKTSSSVRTVAVPSFAAEALRHRLVAVAGEPEDALIFASRNGTPLTTNNVRRRLRAALADGQVDGVTPHAFRRTVATVLSRDGSTELAAEMLGHSSVEITKAHYIEVDDLVDPATADLLESLAPQADE